MMQDGVVCATDTAQRDFSATCLKEFLKWSIKQASKKVGTLRGLSSYCWSIEKIEIKFFLIHGAMLYNVCFDKIIFIISVWIHGCV